MPSGPTCRWLALVASNPHVGAPTGSAGVDLDRHGHLVGDDVVDRRPVAGAFDDLAQFLGGGVALDGEADCDALVAVADVGVEAQ
jgi:hypothetical protein